MSKRVASSDTSITSTKRCKFVKSIDSGDADFTVGLIDTDFNYSCNSDFSDLTPVVGLIAEESIPKASTAEDDSLSDDFTTKKAIARKRTSGNKGVNITFRVITCYFLKVQPGIGLRKFLQNNVHFNPDTVRKWSAQPSVIKGLEDIREKWNGSEFKEVNMDWIVGEALINLAEVPPGIIAKYTEVVGNRIRDIKVESDLRIHKYDKPIILDAIVDDEGIAASEMKVPAVNKSMTVPSGKCFLLTLMYIFCSLTCSLY
jgi:hypothetical protein